MISRERSGDVVYRTDNTRIAYFNSRCQLHCRGGYVKVRHIRSRSAVFHASNDRNSSIVGTRGATSDEGLFAVLGAVSRTLRIV